MVNNEWYNKKAPDNYRGLFNLVSFCTSLPVWQANKNSVEPELVLLRMEIQNDKSFPLSTCEEGLGMRL
jgi:hypothetical protein